jgi:ACS family pantothenate transporter-like MFS transporter
MLGSWYTPRELGKRAMIFWLAGSIGQLFSGFLQAAAYRNLNDVHGFEGWRWLFVIDGIITIPLALIGYIFFPNLPQSGVKTWWTTEEEHKLSLTRLKAVGRAGKESWTKAKAKRILLSWHTYLLPVLYVIWNNGSPQPAMGFWLKSFNAKPAPLPGTKFSVSEINQIPLTTTGIFIVMALVWGWLSDGPFRGARWPFIYAGAFITVSFCNIAPIFYHMRQLLTYAQLIFSVLLRQMPLYKNIYGRKVVFWLSQIGVGLSNCVKCFLCLLACSLAPVP